VPVPCARLTRRHARRRSGQPAGAAASSREGPSDQARRSTDPDETVARTAECGGAPRPRRRSDQPAGTGPPTVTLAAGKH